MKKEVKVACEERILDVLVGQFADEKQRENFRVLLREGTLDDRTIEIEVPPKSGSGSGNTAAAGAGGPGTSFTYDSNTNPGFIADQIFKLAKSGGAGGRRPEKRKMTIAEAMPLIEDMEAERLLDDTDINKEAIASVEENGIVFIDEIDKLVSSSDYRGADASSEGVCILFLVSCVLCLV